MTKAKTQRDADQEQLCRQISAPAGLLEIAEPWTDHYPSS
jgi:hypothetical protein